MLLRLKPLQELPKGLVKPQIQIHSVGLGWSPKFSISNKLPGGTQAPGPCITLREARPHLSVTIPCLLIFPPPIQSHSLKGFFSAAVITENYRYSWFSHVTNFHLKCGPLQFFIFPSYYLQTHWKSLLTTFRYEEGVIFVSEEGWGIRLAVGRKLFSTVKSYIIMAIYLYGSACLVNKLIHCNFKIPKSV